MQWNQRNLKRDLSHPESGLITFATTPNFRRGFQMTRHTLITLTVCFAVTCHLTSEKKVFSPKRCIGPLGVVPIKRLGRCCTGYCARSVMPGTTCCPDNSRRMKLSLAVRDTASADAEPEPRWPVNATVLSALCLCCIAPFGTFPLCSRHSRSPSSDFMKHNHTGADNMNPSVHNS